MKTQPLCSFTNKRNLEQTIADITKHFTVVYEKIYVLQNEEKNHELVCTYNVECNAQLDFTLVSKTISLHRKKLTNTLYTINALNEIIKNINNGILDPKLEIPWDVYSNKILITNKEGLSVIPTRILKIINL